MATDPAAFSESACDLAARISRSCGARESNEFWRLIRQAQQTPAPLTRLELLHMIQDDPEKLTLNDTFALLASRLPVDSKIQQAWEDLAQTLLTSASR